MSSELLRPGFEFRHRLLRAREVSGLGQVEIAKAIEVSHATVSNYENGRTRPTRLQARAWAMACGVDPEWLIEGEDLTRRRASRVLLPDLDSNQEPAGGQPDELPRVIRMWPRAVPRRRAA